MDVYTHCVIDGMVYDMIWYGIYFPYKNTSTIHSRNMSLKNGWICPTQQVLTKYCCFPERSIQFSSVQFVYFIFNT